MYEFFIKQLNRAGVVLQVRLKPLVIRASRNKYGGSLSLNLGITATERVESLVNPFDVFQVFVRNRQLGIVDNSSALNNGFVLWDEYLVDGYQINDEPNGTSTLQISAHNKWGILNWRRSLWQEAIANRSNFENQPVETIGKTIVQYNATADATVANGRLKEGDVLPMGVTLTVEADGGRGATINRQTKGGKILGIITDISKGENAGAFNLIRSGFLTYNLIYTTPYQGQDKTANVIFSLERKTMANPQYGYDIGGLETAGVGLGQRQGDGREVSSVVYSPFYQADFDVEAYYDLQSIIVPSGLDGEVEARLYDNRPTESLSFDVQQTTDTFASPVPVSNRNTYDVGDVGVAKYRGRTILVEVTSLAFFAEGDSIGIDVSVAQLGNEDDTLEL